MTHVWDIPSDTPPGTLCQGSAFCQASTLLSAKHLSVGFVGLTKLTFGTIFQSWGLPGLPGGVPGVPGATQGGLFMVFGRLVP